MKRTSDKRCCGTCKFGDFWLTAKGNFRRSESGRCTYDLTTIALPDVPRTAELLFRSKHGIGPNDHEDCPTYQRFIPAEAKP